MDLPILSLVLSDASWKWSHWDFHPMECCHCPFGTPACQRDPHKYEKPNSADPGEGEYDCSLLNLEAIWGENPKCTQEKEKWQKALRVELASAGIMYDKETEKFYYQEGTVADSSSPPVTPVQHKSISVLELMLRDVDCNDRRLSQLIIEMEAISYSTSDAEVLRHLLRHFIDSLLLRDLAEAHVGCGAAIRKYIALLPLQDLATVRDLLIKERQAPPWFDMEVVKMVRRKLSTISSQALINSGVLACELLTIAESYLHPFLLSKKYCGAIALDAMIALRLLEAPLTARLTVLLAEAPSWFHSLLEREGHTEGDGHGR